MFFSSTACQIWNVLRFVVYNNSWLLRCKVIVPSMPILMIWTRFGKVFRLIVLCWEKNLDVCLFNISEWSCCWCICYGCGACKFASGDCHEVKTVAYYWWCGGGHFSHFITNFVIAVVYFFSFQNFSYRLWFSSLFHSWLLFFALTLTILHWLYICSHSFFYVKLRNWRQVFTLHLKTLIKFSVHSILLHLHSWLLFFY